MPNWENIKKRNQELGYKPASDGGVSSLTEREKAGFNRYTPDELAERSPSYAEQLRKTQERNREIVAERERLAQFPSGNFSRVPEAPDFDVSSDDWVRGASGTFANATLFSIPRTINQGINLAFDWLRNGWNNIGDALGLTDVQSATLGAEMNQSLDAAENALTGDDFYSRLTEDNEAFARNVQARSESAAALYPLIDTLGQIGLTAGTAGVGAAAGLSDDAVRGTMMAQDFARNLGEGYTSRREEDRSFENALAGALLEAAPTTAIEFAGGTENLIQDAARGGINGVSGWLGRAAESAVEEAVEEIAQDPLGGIADRLIGEDVPLVAEDLFDPSSEGILNVRRALDSAGYAMLGSLVAGGAGAAVNGAENYIENAPIRQAAREQRRAEREARRAQAAQQAEEAEQQTPEAIALRMARGEDVGRTAAIEAGAADAAADDIERYAATLGENGGNAYRQSAPRDASQTEAQGFRNAFTAYYRMGTYGGEFEDVDSSFRSFIPEAEARQAFWAGQNDRAAEMETAQNQTPVSAEGARGLTSTPEAAEVDEQTRVYLDEMGRALGVEIRIENAPVDADGRPAYNGRVEGNTIYLSAQSENALGDVLNHELTHVIQQRNPEQYQAYKDLVASYLEQQNPGFIQSEVDRITAAYSAQGQAIGQSEAIDDIVADAATEFLSSPEAAANVVEQDKGLARRILDAIKDVLSRIGNAIRGSGTRASRMLRESESTFRQAEEIWTRALAESVPEGSRTKETAGSRKVGRVRYQLRDDTGGNPEDRRGNMTAEERARYDALEVEMEAVTKEYRQANDRVQEIKNSAAYQRFREEKRAQGKLLRATPEDRENYPVVRELYDARQEAARLREMVDRLYEEQYAIEVAARRRGEAAETSRPAYTEGSEEADARRQEAVEAFGLTRDWRETGYILKGGERLNFRGEGGRAGTRGEDHRAVAQLYEGEGISQSEALVAFVNEGNVRVSPEIPGVTVAVGTTLSEEQERALKRFIEQNGTEYFMAEVIDGNGDTAATLEYNRNANPDRVIREMRETMRTGQAPQRSNVAEFHSRYQLSEDVEADESADIAALNAEVAEMLNAGDDEVNAEFAALRAQARVLQNANISADQAREIARQAAEDYGIRNETQAAKLRQTVQDAAETMRKRGEAGFNEAMAAIYSAAREAVGASERLDDSLYNEQQVKGIRDFLRETPVYVSPEIRAGWTDWGAFRRKNTGRLRMVNSQIYTGKDGISRTVRGVDQVYMELTEMAPQYFPAENINPEDQLNAMADFWDAIQPVYVRQFNDREGITMEQAEAAMDLTADILSQIGGTADTSRLSERQAEALRKQVREFEKANRALRRKYEQRSAALEKARARTKEVRADERERAAERVQTARTRERERAAERLEAVKTHNREVRERAAERRKASAERRRIEKAAGRMTRKLERPTDTQHVPEELRGVVADFLKTLDFSSSAARNSSAEGGATKKTLAWQALYNRLDAISKQSRESDASLLFQHLDPDLMPRIQKLIQDGVPQRIAELDSTNLSEIYKVVRAVEKGIIEVDNIRVNGQMQSATETARGIIDDTRKGWKALGGGVVRRKLSQFFKWDLMDPTRFSDLFGSHFKEVYQNLRQAENVKIRHWAELESWFTGLKKDLKLSDRKLRRLEEEYISVSFTGRKNPVKMSRAQVMSLYLTDKREQGRKHLYSSGGQGQPSHDAGRGEDDHQPADHAGEGAGRRDTEIYFPRDGKMGECSQPGSVWI